MKHKLTLTMGAVLVTSLACERGAELEPAKTANELPNVEDAAQAQEEGVELTARANEWPGDAEVESEITPIRITLRNDSGESLQVRYGDFQLVAEDGTTYHAIPPRQVSGVVDDETYVEPAFGYWGFHPAPYYGGYFTTEPYDGVFAYDDAYYDTYYGYWDDVAFLPTTEMLRWALPEGVLDSGGNLEGYLYFQRVDEEEDSKITLKSELSSTEGDRTVASIQVPFVVD